MFVPEFQAVHADNLCVLSQVCSGFKGKKNLFSFLHFCNAKSFHLVSVFFFSIMFLPEIQAVHADNRIMPPVQREKKLVFLCGKTKSISCRLPFFRSCLLVVLGFVVFLLLIFSKINVFVSVFHCLCSDNLNRCIGPF